MNAGADGQRRWPQRRRREAGLRHVLHEHGGGQQPAEPGAASQPASMLSATTARPPGHGESVDLACGHATAREPPDPRPDSTANGADPICRIFGLGCVLPSVIGKTHFVTGCGS